MSELYTYESVFAALCTFTENFELPHVVVTRTGQTFIEIDSAKLFALPIYNFPDFFTPL